MEKIIDLYPGIAIYKAHVDEYREQDINARIMYKEKFERLKQNIQDDERLESLPLCYLHTNESGNEELMIISGHHRIRAARMANITIVYSLVILEELTPDQVKSKQLAHNALNGHDDPQLLKQIFDSIQDVNAKIASGVFEEEVKKAYKQVNLDEINVEFDYEIVRIVFLRSQFDKFNEAVKLIEKDESVLIADYKDFDKIAEAIRKVSTVENVRNIAAILMKMSEIITEYYGKE